MASVPYNYEINVAKRSSKDDLYGIYFCKIEIPETFEKDAEKKLEFLRNLFGEDFHLSMTYWKCSGTMKKEWE